MCDHFLPKLTASIRAVDREQLWRREGENLNSIGGIVLHIDEHVRRNAIFLTSRDVVFSTGIEEHFPDLLLSPEELIPLTSSVPLVFFSVLEMWLVRRMWRGLMQEPSFFRDYLLDETRRDGLILVFAALFVSVYSVRAGWDGETLPLLLTWVGFRMAALWKGTRQLGGVGSGGYEWLWIGLFLAAGWSLTFFGPFLYSIVVNGIVTLVSPPLYGAGWVVQYLVGVLSEHGRHVEPRRFFSSEKQETGSLIIDTSDTVSASPEGWAWLVPLLLAVVMAGVFFYFSRRLQMKKQSGEKKFPCRRVKFRIAP